jgi:hypothetical protein
MGADKVERPVVGTGKVPTLTAWVRMYHGSIKGKFTIRWDHIPNPAPTNGAYYVHLIWTFFQLTLNKCFDLF